MAPRAVVWFRSDLRLRDNQLLHHAEVREAAELVAVYCVDARHFGASKFGGHGRTGRHRARFLAEALEALDRSLRGLGSRLLVAAGRPEDVIPGLVGPGGVLAFQSEDAHEEQKVEAAVLRGLVASAAVKCHRGQSLLHREDLGFDVRESLPLPFGKYFYGTCDRVRPRAELPAPAAGDLPPPASATAEAAVRAGWSEVAARVDALAALLGFDAAAPASGEGDFVWRGGEAAGLERLAAYAAPGGLGHYHRTRNQLSGADFSSHLSPWLAHGCLSPRTVYFVAKGFERANAGRERDPRFDHVHKFVFQLCWRDYFRLYSAHFGRRVFFREGPARRDRPWRRDSDVEARWKQGRTGVPLVDALMRELAATGYMSNRGRYVVASYLVHFLGVDWRVGADWFESLLIDHDVYINYGEWASMANIAVDLGERYPLGLKGRGPTQGRLPGAQGGGGDPWAKGAGSGDPVFDPWEQAAHYDRDEAFVRRWLPELRGVPPGSAHRPQGLDAAARTAAVGVGAYPRPLASQAVALAARPEGPCDAGSGEKGRGGPGPRAQEGLGSICRRACRGHSPDFRGAGKPSPEL